MTEAIENLGSNCVVDENGDVKSAADFLSTPMPNPGRIARMRKKRLVEDPAIRIKLTADFSERNEILLDMAAGIAKSNRHGGAAVKLSRGNKVPRYRGSDHARMLELQELRSYRARGAAACRACPLEEFCNTVGPSDGIREALKDPNKRERFKRTLGSQSNLFCDEMVIPKK
ncbi:hypothetical protein KC945_00135 [Candidatus Saccharibacteria bacterium]|jgi:hypothetical protein|nr:hypothetical protein [Candidatus Saccharibacteria bacterium]